MTTRASAYYRWHNMLSRCFRPSHAAFKNYGGRGIGVRLSWLSFDAFLIDMGLPPAGKSLDRTDNDGPYSPENCQWASALEQGANRRTTTLITVGEETRDVSQWARRLGVTAAAVHRRINVMGWSPERAVTEPRQDQGRRPRNQYTGRFARTTIGIRI